MPSKLDDLLRAIIAAKDAGLSVGRIKTKFIGKSGAKASARRSEMEEQLASLVQAGEIWGPLNRAATWHGVARSFHRMGGSMLRNSMDVG